MLQVWLCRVLAFVFMWLLSCLFLQRTGRACLYLCGEFCLGTFCFFSGLYIKYIYNFSIKGYSEERGSLSCEMIRLGHCCQDFPQPVFSWEVVKLKRAFPLLRLSIISAKKLPSVPSKNLLGTTKMSSSSCLFLLLFVLVYRHFREAPCAGFLGKARGFSLQCCPVGTSLLMLEVGSFQSCAAG